MKVAAILFRPDHEGTIKQRVLSCGSRVISKIFGKVMVTDADLTLTKKRLVFRPDFGDRNATVGVVSVHCVRLR